LDRVDYGGGPAGDSELPVDVLEAILDRFSADDEASRRDEDQTVACAVQ
jgi:hypothetical protein